MKIEKYDFNENLNKTAICIVTAQRPKYFEQVLQSVEGQIGDRDVFVFIDFPESKFSPSIQQKNIDLSKKYLPENQTTLIVQQSNAGCGKSMVKAREWVFDHLLYGRAFIMEDDLVLSTGYFDLCENLMNWTDKNYSNVGMTQGWGEQGVKRLAEPFDVYACYDHFWSYLINRNCWIQLKPFFTQFMEMFMRNIPTYAHRNHQAIMQWKHNIIQQMTPNKQNFLNQGSPGGFPDNDEMGQRKSIMQTSGQDSVNLLGLYYTNQVRVAPVKGRSSPIGEYGIHFNPQVFARKGFDKWKMFQHPDDSTNKEFKAVSLKD